MTGLRKFEIAATNSDLSNFVVVTLTRNEVDEEVYTVNSETIDGFYISSGLSLIEAINLFNSRVIDSL